jgi:hypothetical protein
MKWFSLKKKCDLCGLTGSSVINIDHGDKKIRLCSLQWNDWLHTLFGNEADITLNEFLIKSPACESDAC